MIVESLQVVRKFNHRLACSPSQPVQSYSHVSLSIKDKLTDKLIAINTHNLYMLQFLDTEHNNFSLTEYADPNLFLILLVYFFTPILNVTSDFYISRRGNKYSCYLLFSTFCFGGVRCLIHCYLCFTDPVRGNLLSPQAQDQYCHQTMHRSINLEH